MKVGDFFCPRAALEERDTSRREELPRMSSDPHQQPGTVAAQDAAGEKVLYTEEEMRRAISPSPSRPRRADVKGLLRGEYTTMARERQGR